MLLSIIIPAFNVEKYIQSSLLSILSQSNGRVDFEIIVVNDGSKDNTKSIIEEMSFQFPTIKAIHQDNAGVSAARNVGIESAKGKYVLFLDADDKLEHNVLFSILEISNYQEVDLVLLGYRKVNEFGEVKYQTDFAGYDGKTHETLSAYYQLIGENNVVADTNRCWGILYKTSKLKSVAQPFPIGVPYLEDAAFLAKFFVIMHSYVVFNKIVCSRLIREGSAVNSNLFNSERAIQGFDLALKDLCAFRNTNVSLKIFPDRKSHLNQSIIKFATLRVISAMHTGSKDILQQTIAKIESEKLAIQFWGVRYPFNLWGAAYAISIQLFIVVFKMHTRLRFIKSKLKLG